MNARALKDLLCDGPQSDLLEAVDSGRDHKDLLPLLDAELQRSSSRLRRLRKYRNTLASPFHNLLPEVLSHIFFVYAQDNNALFNLRWTRLLLVCRRWHDIGIMTPKLWSFIDLSSTRYDPFDDDWSLEARYVKRVQDQVARAGLWPCTVTMNLQDGLSDIKKACLPMFWNPSTLRSLTLNGNATFNAPILQALAAHRHDIVTQLTVCTPNPSPFLESARLPDIFTGDNLPKLRYLTLRGLRVHWASLHDLCVIDIGWRTGNDRTYVLLEIIDALTRCPALEHLHLDLQDSDSHDLEFIDSPQTVTLAKAETISIHGPAEICRGLSQALKGGVPCTARLITSTRDAPQSSMESSPLSSLTADIVEHICRAGAPVIRAVSLVHLVQYETGQTGISGHLQLDRSLSVWVESGYMPSEPYVHFSTSTYTHPPYTLPPIDPFESWFSFQKLVTSLLQSWPLAHVTHLDVRLTSWNSDIPWRSLFDNLSAVTTIVLRPELHSALSLLEFLFMQLHDHGQRVVANIIFDAQRVENFLTYVSGIPVAIEALSRRVIMRMLSYCAAAAQAGVPLDTVEIMNDLVASGTKVRLLEPAGDIDWSELYKDLSGGFVYGGVLYNASVGCEGTSVQSSLYGDLPPPSPRTQRRRLSIGRPVSPPSEQFSGIP